MDASTRMHGRAYALACALVCSMVWKKYQTLGRMPFFTTLALVWALLWALRLVIQPLEKLR